MLRLFISFQGHLLPGIEFQCSGNFFCFVSLMVCFIVLDSASSYKWFSFDVISAFQEFLFKVPVQNIESARWLDDQCPRLSKCENTIMMPSAVREIDPVSGRSRTSIYFGESRRKSLQDSHSVSSGRLVKKQTIFRNCTISWRRANMSTSHSSLTTANKFHVIGKSGFHRIVQSCIWMFCFCGRQGYSW